MQDADIPYLPSRAVESHKGDFGTVLVVGGSVGMAGAPALSGMAALRAGAGLVRIAVPEPCLTVTAAFEPSYMCAPLPSDRHGRFSLSAQAPLWKLSESSTWIACGPGMGRSAALDRLIARLYCEWPKPCLLDADALNALAEQPGLLRSPGGPRILTPHPGEFARLCGHKHGDRQSQCRAAEELACECNVTVVLKGHRTFVAGRGKTYVNHTGNPGMASGGSGDVLTGIISALGAQGMSDFDAARLGVYLHGLAGDLAAARLGEESLTASELIRFLPVAFRRYRRERSARGSSA